MKSERTEEYLESIYKRQETENPVSTSSLAADLAVSLPAVTDMMRRLEANRLIDYSHNKGASLTKEGERIALSVIRRHRLWERFLVDILGLRWDEVHDEACRLEHAMSPETTDKLASLLGEAADTCPHGHPIPDKEGHITHEKISPLSMFKPGQKVCVSAVAIESPKLLRNIEKWGLKPKTVVSIENKDSDGTMQLKLDNRVITIKKEAADSLLVKPFLIDKDTASAVAILMSELKTGESAVVKSYKGDRGMLGRLLCMGFTPGSLVKMVKNFSGDPVLIKIRGTEVALDRTMAGRMIVVRKKDEC